MALEYHPEGGRHSSKGPKKKKKKTPFSSASMAQRQSPFKLHSDTQPSYSTPHRIKQCSGFLGNLRSLLSKSHPYREKTHKPSQSLPLNLHIIYTHCFNVTTVERHSEPH